MRKSNENRLIPAKSSNNGIGAGEGLFGRKHTITTQDQITLQSFDMFTEIKKQPDVQSPYIHKNPSIP